MGVNIFKEANTIDVHRSLLSLVYKYEADADACALDLQ